MTAVVIIDDLPNTGLIPDGGAERLAGGKDAPTVAAPAFLDLAQQRLEQQRAMIVLYPAWSSARSVKLIRLARNVLNTDRIAGLKLDLPPLALSLIADQLAFLSSYVSPGVLASLGYRLAKEIVAGAWLNSVASLDHFEIKVGQHMASYLPGAFMVTAAPSKGVHKITASYPVGEIPTRPADPIRLLVSGDAGDKKWLDKGLVPALKPAGVTPVQAQPLGPKFWGSKKYLEFVAFSTHPQALTHALHSTPCRPCGWCHEPTALPDCPFCGMHQKWADTVAEASQPSPAPTPDPAGPTGPVAAQTTQRQPPPPAAPTQRPAAPKHAAAQQQPAPKWWDSGQADRSIAPADAAQKETPWWASSGSQGLSGTAARPDRQPNQPSVQAPQAPPPSAGEVGATQPSRVAQGIVIPPSKSRPNQPAPPHPGDRRVAGGPPGQAADSSPEETQRVVPPERHPNGMAMGDLLAAGEAAANDRSEPDYFVPARKPGRPAETE